MTCRILAFRHWMEKIGDGHKPLFLTEFGVLYGNGCCDRPVDPQDKLVAFMRESIAWLEQPRAVDAWAWFATYSELYNGSLMSPQGELNGAGRAYRELQAR